VIASLVAAANIPAGEYVPTADHRVVVAGATWEHYELELAMRGEKSAPRLAYLEGVPGLDLLEDQQAALGIGDVEQVA
jgi:hypothetical protein